MAHTADSNSTENSKTVGEKTSEQLLSLVRKVTTTGIGSLSGSTVWAENRLARVQGDRYVPTTTPLRPIRPGEQEDIDRTIKRLIRESVEAASVNGFVTSLGGFIPMPVTIPANIAGAIVINARLAAAIAYLRGYDPQDPHVATVALLVATGSNAQQVAKSFGIKVGEKFAMQAIRKFPMSVVRAINKKVGFSLITKYGTKRSAITLSKGIPLVGGVIGGTVDATSTALVGRTARAMFPHDSGAGTRDMP